jgi:dethiobiotin synthetase
MAGIFVTGTGTGIGKTLVTTLLIGQLRARGAAVAALKPVISGYDEADGAASDSGLLLHALGLPATAETVAGISPWRFAAPISPDMAAAREGRHLDAAEIAAFCRAADREGQITLAEGVGGAMVPLNGSETVLDVMAALGWPALVVAGSYLGTLSHTLTTLHALSGRVPIAGLVVSESPESPVPLTETVATLARFAAPAPVVALPRLGAPHGLLASPPDLAALVTGTAS